MTCDYCRNELHPRNIVLSGQPTKDFALPQAKCGPLLHVVWIIYRYLVAFYLTVWLGLILYEFGEEPFYAIRDNKWKWFIQVSNWSYIITILYFYSAAFNTSYYYYNNRGTMSSETNSLRQTDVDLTATDVPDYRSIAGRDDNIGTDCDIVTPQVLTPWYCKIQWLLQITCYAGVLFITILYWIAVASADGDPVSAYILHVHGITLLIAVIDVMLVANPTRVGHVVYVSLFSLAYLFFTVIYWAAGGTNGRIPDSTYIYKRFLDWGEQPGTTTAVFMVSILIIVPTCHLFFYGLYRLKCVLYRRFTSVSQITNE